MQGGRLSLLVGVSATLVSITIGVLYGAVAGYVGGRIDNLMMRIVDVMYALPYMFLVIILMVLVRAVRETVSVPPLLEPLLHPTLVLFLALGAVQWLTMARIVRGQTMSVKRKEYVESALAIGLTTPRIIRRYIVPNVIGPVIVFVTLLIPTNIIVESYLSFLGLGVQEPLTSWGLLISQGATQLNTAPWLLVFPATFLAITMFCFNFIGDGLRDALDPRDR
jgi:oligopeptide transport system permease protein